MKAVKDSSEIKFEKLQGDRKWAISIKEMKLRRFPMYWISIRIFETRKEKTLI